MFSILRLFAGSFTKSMSNRVTNNEISGKFTHTPMHRDFAITLMETPGYFFTALSLLIHAIIFSENPFPISP